MSSYLIALHLCHVLLVIYIFFRCYFTSPVDHELGGGHQYIDDQFPYHVCSDPPWRTVPARTSLRTPAQNIWPHGSKSQHNDNHYTIRHKSATKRVYEAILVGQHVQPSMTPIKVYWKRKSCLRLRLGAAPLHRLWLGYWFLASLTVQSSGLSRR